MKSFLISPLPVTLLVGCQVNLISDKGAEQFATALGSALSQGLSAIEAQAPHLMEVEYAMHAFTVETKGGRQIMPS